MSVRIARLALKSLWNNEYTMFVNQIVEIVKKYKPDDLNLTNAFKALLDLMPEMAKIKAQEQSNALSNLLHGLDVERDIIVDAIIDQVKVMGKLTIPSIAPHVIVLSRFFDIHGRDIADARYNEETQRINNLLADYNAKPDVKQAAADLHLTILFDQLATVNASFAANFMLRTEGDASIEKVDSRAIRAKIDPVLVDFFTSFEHCSREYPTLDYKTPSNELNNLINYYKTQLKARATRRNSGKDISTEPPIVKPV